MRPGRYLLSASVLLLLLGFSPIFGLQHDEPTSPSPVEPSWTSKAVDIAIDPSNSSTIGAPSGANKAASSSSSSTQAPASSAKRQTVKPSGPASSKQPVANCPDPCLCPNERELNCEDLDLTQLPKLDAKSTFVRLHFARNNIELLDFRQLKNADRLELLDLSENTLRNISLPKRPSAASLPQLRKLILSDNSLESMANLSGWLMPLLEELDVSRNEIKQLQLGAPDSRPKLAKLVGSQLKLRQIDELALAGAPNLTFLNLSHANTDQGHFLESSAFARLTQLRTLDLSANHLLEVPAALRSANSLKTLILNKNPMTSLRPADFVKLTNLEYLELRNCPILRRVDANTFGNLLKLNTLIIADNPSLMDFSPEAFSPLVAAAHQAARPGTKLKLLDLSANNLTTLARIDEFAVPVAQLRLAGNPLDCNCQLEWLVKLPNLSQQQPIHCATPAKYHHLELSQFFEIHDCTQDDSILQRWVVTLCILFLLLVTIAVFVQKTNLFRRLQWRDQYGTIYYTKARYPQQEQL